MDTIEELGEEIASLSAHLDAATHHLLECIRLFDEACGWRDTGAVSCAHWLAWRVGWDTATARERVRVARALGKLSAIDDALHSGRLSYAKVRALTRVATPDNEADLLDRALIATAAQLERICRGYRSVIEREREPRPEERTVQRRLLPGGMVRLELVLEPDEADLILRAVDRAREVRAAQREAAAQGERPVDQPRSVKAAQTAAAHQVAPQPNQMESAAPAEVADISAETPWPSRADGAVELAESFLAGNPVAGSGGERFQVMVHLDQDALGPDGAMTGTLEDGTRISAEALRRVACDCGLVAVRIDGEALDIGRRTRSIPPAIRRALMLRDRGCAFPGCTHARFLHAHHVEHWLHGGKTSLENLVMLCTFHHHLVHEGGWKVTAAADGVYRFESPVGKLLSAEPPREGVHGALAWLYELVDESGLSIGPETNLPQWDGKSPDYELAVSGLLAAG
jgi:hypothetical protein